MRWVGGFLLAGAMIGAGAWGLRPSAGAEPPPAPGATSAPEWRGAASCAAAACHNGNGPKGRRGSEYTTWVTRDPHSRAYEVLSGERSLRIEKAFRELASTKETRPECDALCLNCHVAPGVVPLSSKNPCEVPRRGASSFEDGVSCEACHGPAGGWLTQHYTDAWRAKKPADKVKAGMWDTKNLAARAEVCVACHVGKEDLDVNHDLIAAGHPRLAFEYGAFLANMPKHWDAGKEKEGRPDLEAQVWLIGQVVSARSALELLHDRAAGKEKPWPEFAEADCFACHHALTDQEWRQSRKPAGARHGTPAWGTWYFALGDVVKENAPGQELTYPDDALTNLRRLMTAPDPDRARVAAEAARAAEALSAWSPALREKDPRWGPEKLAKSLDQRARTKLAGCGWDEAAQLYLGLAAQRPEWRRDDFLSGLRAKLQFRRGEDSPRDFDPRALDRDLNRR